MSSHSSSDELSLSDADLLAQQEDLSLLRESPEVSNDFRLPPPARLPAEAARFTRSSVEVPLPDDDDVARPPSIAPVAPALARFARYDVIGRLAIGGMAEIYLAREATQGDVMRHVVVKVLRQKLGTLEDERYFEEMFLREGRVAVQLEHPSICHVHEFGKWGGHFFIAMEWIDGASLREVYNKLTAKGARLPAAMAAGIISQIAGALEYAHTARDTRNRALGVVHRDVNPQNIMLRSDGVVKLLDFGVAKVAEPHDESRSDAVKGKFGYMAPEQCLAKPLDVRADVFALGICLYELLAGKRLYKRESQFEIFKAIIQDPVPSVREVAPDVPEALEAIVRNALAKAPENRFESAGQMQAVLDAYLTEARELVNAPRLAKVMHDVFGDQRARGPALYTGPDVATRLRATASHTPLTMSDRPPDVEPPAAVAVTARSRESPKRIAVMLLILVVVAVGSWQLGRAGREPSAQPIPPAVSIAK